MRIFYNLASKIKDANLSNDEIYILIIETIKKCTNGDIWEHIYNMKFMIPK